GSGGKDTMCLCRCVRHRLALKQEIGCNMPPFFTTFCNPITVRSLELGIVMKVDAICHATLSVACLASVGCQAKVAEKDAPPFRIIATDVGFEAPDRVAAGLRHIVFETHGFGIHESMLVKLPKGMSAENYVAAVK